MPTVHSVKCISEYFTLTSHGLKYFEYRRNDRGYQVNDFVTLNEVNDALEPTGRTLSYRIAAIIDDRDIGLPGGYVILIFYPWQVTPS
jgi:hypothetical protein